MERGSVYVLEYLHPIADRPILDLDIASVPRLEQCVSGEV